MSYECWNLADIPSDDEEMVEGYRDGRAGEPRSGDNRSRAYQHGWYTGAHDAGHIEAPAWLMVLAAEMVASWRKEKSA